MKSFFSNFKTYSKTPILTFFAHFATMYNIVFTKKRAERKLSTYIFPPAKLLLWKLIIKLVSEKSNLLERTEIELRSNSPRSSQIQDSLYKIAHFCCTFYYIFLPKLSSISHNFQTSDSVIFRVSLIKMKFKFSKSTFHLFIKLQENLFQVFVIIRIPLSRFFLNLIILKRAMFPYFWTFLFIIFSNYFSWIFSNHKFSFF